MASWVNHTSATMQSHSPARRSGAGSDRGSPAPASYSTRSTRSSSNSVNAANVMQPSQGGPQQQQQHAHYINQQQAMQRPIHHQSAPSQQYTLSQQQQQQFRFQHTTPPPPPPHQQQPIRYPMNGAGGAPMQPHHAHPQHFPSGSHPSGGFQPRQMHNAFGTYSTYASRIREGNTALLLPPALGRRAKRAAQASMMESDDDDWDFEESPRSTPSSRMQRQMEKERLEKEKKAWVRRPRKTRHTINQQNDLEAVAGHEAILVPIRLDIDTDEVRLRDTFTWNVNEQLMTPEHFAEILCEDLDLNMAKFVPEIAQSLRNQIAEFEPIAEVQVPSEGARVIIQLDLHVGGINLRDRFEWDVGSDLTPEEFAKQLASDLGIGGEFVSLISHEIHEQLYRYKQDRLLDRGFDAEPLYSGVRPLDDGENWCPALETLTAEEYEKIVETNDRSIRLKRRETSRYSRRRGGGFVSRGFGSGIGGGAGVGMTNYGKRGRPNKPFRNFDIEHFENWQCHQCGLGAPSTIMLRTGPAGEKSLCNTCGIYWSINGALPEHRKGLFVFKTEAVDQVHVADTTASSAIASPFAGEGEETGGVSEGAKDAASDISATRVEVNEAAQ